MQKQSSDLQVQESICPLEIAGLGMYEWHRQTNLADTGSSCLTNPFIRGTITMEQPRVKEWHKWNIIVSQSDNSLSDQKRYFFLCSVKQSVSRL